VVGYAPFLEREDFDRGTVDLPAGQDELIEAVTKANKNTIVVVNAGSPVTMSKWLDQAAAVLDMWYGGQEGGHAIAAILFGDVNPRANCQLHSPRSGRTAPPAAIIRGPTCTSSTRRAFMWAIGTSTSTTSSRCSVRSRPFIHQVRIQQFEGRPRHGGARTTGQRDPAGPQHGRARRGEVVQLYVHDVQSSLPRPPQELKGFTG